MKERTKFHVGLDVHKDSISVAAAELGRAPARLIGKVTHDLNKLLKVLAKIGSAEQLHIVYEAGPTGFGLQRALKERGYLCEIIAPSQIPRRPGDRAKTDRRDCIQLAECSRAGQLSAVWDTRAWRRSDPRLGAGARRRRQQPCPGPAPTQGLFAAP